MTYFNPLPIYQSKIHVDLSNYWLIHTFSRLFLKMTVNESNFHTLDNTFGEIVRNIHHLEPLKD